MLRTNMALLFFVVFCALGVVTSQHKARKLFQQLESAQDARRLSRARYDGGVTSYLEVLDTERSLFSAELTESQTLRLYFDSVICLYKALGGGWNPEP